MEPIDPNRPFADWPALVEYVRATWPLDHKDDDALAFARTWEWANPERSQLVTVSRRTFDDEVWVVLSSAIANADDLTDREILEHTAVEIGRIVRAEDRCWLEQILPLALLTPAALERWAESFAIRADNIELHVTGGQDDF